MTQAQAQALAAFVWRIRDDWDQPGILAAIRKAGTLGTPAEIGTALCRLAGNRELRTPALLSEPGPHWHETSVASRVWPVMCEQHPHVRASRCDVDGPCAAYVTPAGIAAVRTALRDAPKPPRRVPPVDVAEVRTRKVSS